MVVKHGNESHGIRIHQKSQKKNQQKTMFRTKCLLHQPVFVFIVLLKHQTDKPWKLPTEGWEMRQHSLNAESVPK